MDLLCLPEDPSFPVDKTPYVCQETRWDCGPFLTYACRRGKIGSIPPTLRSGALESDEPYLEGLYPTPQEEQQRFYQTWFYFGLLAEFFGLNESENGERMVDAAQASRELEALYFDCRVVEIDHTYVSGLIVRDKGPRIMKRIREAKVGLQARMSYLRECLYLTNAMLNSIHCEFEESIKYSIAALGELFSTAMHTALTLGKLDVNLESLAFTWSRGYIQPGGEVEAKMFQNGWCKSEVERVRFIGGLNTIHFLSRLKRSIPTRNHSNCTTRACVAFQINLETYTTTHGLENCPCPETEVDLKAVFNILETTDSYPVLHLKLSRDLDDVEMSVETYMPYVPYVALSHVWADGLGNPRRNALPRCQIKNLAQLVANLQRLVETSTGSSTEQTSYRLWIDTLCCPIEEKRKRIALERIAAVYRNATHVLVLDASLSSYKAINVHPAETLLRIFHTSAWMRRLWTLQEGALARSLYVQFADGPVKAFGQMEQLLHTGLRQVNYMRIRLDLDIEFNLLHGFEELTTPEYSGSMKWPRSNLMTLQRALHFRTVTKPSDEALCIATLLSLDIKYIAAVEDTQERMARVWELVAKAGDGIPARIIFLADNLLDKEGWRWAPRSLLDSGPESNIDLHAKVTRFNFGDGVGRPANMGVPEPPLGLRVQFAGSLLQVRPRVNGTLARMPLHPWNGIIKPTEDQILAQDARTGKWFRIVDWYRSHKISPLAAERQAEYDRVADNPLCKAIDGGDCALIREKTSAFDGVQICLLVKIKAAESEAPPDPTPKRSLCVRRLRQVMISELNAAEVLVFENVRKIADDVAKEDVTDNLLRISNHHSEEYSNALEMVRLRMKALMAENWNTNRHFVQAAHDTLAPDMREYMWASIPKLFSHDINSVDLPEDHAWIVD